MSINFISSTDSKSKKITKFNIGIARSGKDKDLKKIVDGLVFQQDAASGKIYIQTETADHWFIDDKETIARLLNKDQLDLILKWDQKDLLVSDEQLELLIAIGGCHLMNMLLIPRA